jgi:hypothetical protein
MRRADRGSLSNVIAEVGRANTISACFRSDFQAQFAAGQAPLWPRAPPPPDCRECQKKTVERLKGLSRCQNRGRSRSETAIRACLDAVNADPNAVLRRGSRRGLSDGALRSTDTNGRADYQPSDAFVRWLKDE